MQLLRSKTQIILMLLCTAVNVCLADTLKLREGLFFHSFETHKDLRTGLDLTPGEPFVFPDGFTMEFDIKLRSEVQNFGCIFRIVANDTLNIDLVSDYYAGNAENIFALVTQHKNMAAFLRNAFDKDAFDDWMQVRISINSRKKTLSLSLGDVTKYMDLPLQASRYRITFGNNTNKNANVTDVPPIAVKDIRIYDGNQDLVREWKLTKHAGCRVYDECGNHLAVAVHPVWMADEHIRWRKRQSFSLPGIFYQYAFDPVGKRIFIAGKEQVIVCHASSNQADTIRVKHGIPYNLETNQLVYDPVNDELVCYDFGFDHLSRFNFKTATWTEDNDEKIKSDYGHHGKYYLPDQKKVVAFGGYGYHKYSSLLQIYDETTRKWQVSNLANRIPPRYLGSMGQLDKDCFLYFGGFGNHSGNQTELPENFYDLYTVNIRNSDVQKVWELQTPDNHFTNANSMVIDTARKVFYTLSYPNSRYATLASLHEYSLDKPEYRMVGDSIPYQFYDVESYSDLYISKDRLNMYALTSEVHDGGSIITVYSIAYPPLSYESVVQMQSAGTSRLWYLLLLLFIPLGIFVWWKWKKCRIIVPADAKISGEIPVMTPLTQQQLKRKAIYLLGEFRLIDGQGANLGASFSPTTRQLFLMMLMYTLKNGVGISSNELGNLLWEDKDEVSARNIRNVYINKLRTSIKGINDVEIVKCDGYWKVNFTEDIYCDYAKAQKLIAALNHDAFNKAFLDDLLDIAARGKLLAYIDVEWLDNFKSDYTNSLIELLISISKAPQLRNDYSTLLKIANAILIQDNVEEYAVKLKCYILKHLKRSNDIRTCYQRFVDDYRKLYATKPEMTLEDLLKFRLEG